MRGLALVGVMVLAGCQESDGVTPTEDACGADGYRSLMGVNIAAVTLPAALNHRVIGPDTGVTMDFVPERLNIQVDGDGVVTGLDCG